MEAIAKVKHLRISARKVRPVVDLIRGRKVDEAFAVLRAVPHRATGHVQKVLKSAVANAEHNFSMATDDLVVSQVYVDEGPTLKRMFPRAMGRADVRRRRTSHITVVVADTGGK
ncbi:MAG TPA: 50S ribosomal protein L22 [Spirochaetia bacterium]|nr:50S ribosomal protein L22 [Spirochaetia bacterium]